MTAENTVTDEGDKAVELAKIETERDTFLDNLTTFKITDKPSFDVAALHLEAIGSMKKVIKAYWKPLIDSAFDTKKSASEALRNVKDKEEECLARSEKADAHVRKLRLTFKTAQDKKDRIAKEKAEALAEKEAKKAADKLLKKAEKTADPVREEKLIEKAEEVKVAPVFIPKTVKRSERTASGTLNTFIPVIEVEVHDIKSICGMIFRGDLPVNVVTVSEPKIKAWAKSFDKEPGMYDGFNLNKTEKERITGRKG